MSHTERTPSRRGLLARGTAALLTGAAIATTAQAAPVASLGGAGADAELIALCANQDEAWAFALTIQAEGKTLPPGITAQSRDQERRLADALHEHSYLIDQISDLPAATLAGVRAKAQAMLDVLERIVAPDKGAKSLDDIASGDAGQIEDCLSLSLARDVLAVVGGAAA